MGRHQFLRIAAEHQVADLRLGLDRLQLLALHRVPELDAAVSRATARDEKALLVGAESERFNGSLVGCKAPERLRLPVRRPDEELVIVAARGYLLLVEGPLQSTDLLLVASKLGDVV